MRRPYYIQTRKLPHVSASTLDSASFGSTAVHPDGILHDTVTVVVAVVMIRGRETADGREASRLTGRR